MRESTILPALIYLQEPNDGRQKDNRRLHKEVSLFLYPRAVEVEHDGVGTLVGIWDVCHKGRIDWVATMASSWVVEVNHKELRLYLVGIKVVEQMVVGNFRKVGKLIVVNIHRKTLLYLLLDVVVHNGVGLTRTGSAEHHWGTEGIDYVNPAIVPLLFIVEACRQIDGVFVLHQPSFLHKTLILRVEYIIHQVVFEQSAHPYATHQQTDIAHGQREDIERSGTDLAYG